MTRMCGKHFGHFPDEHASPPPSDDEGGDGDSEAEKYMPKHHKDAIKVNKNVFSKLKVQAAGLQDDAVAELLRGWMPYLSQTMAGSHIRAEKAKISPLMMSKLGGIAQLQTLVIIYCHLKEFPPVEELEGLLELRLSHNKIRSIGKARDSSAKGSKLKKFICDWNLVEVIEPGFLSGEFVKDLEVVMLAHNELNYLPRDFLGPDAKNLVYLDLSFNNIGELPHSICACVKLQLLYLHNNQLNSLPPDLGHLTALRKLFVSYNNLKEVPQSIGLCSKLEKVRVSFNQIRFLPDDFIMLWKPPNEKKLSYKGKDIAGVLEELLVDGNPLVQPSITAFEMGGAADGLNRAMGLFWEWLQDKGAADKQAPALLDMQHVPTESSANQPNTPASRKSLRIATIVSNATHKAAQAKHMSPGQRYYFGHLDGKPDELARKIARIRTRESELLLLKKKMYIEQQRRVAKELKQMAADRLAQHQRDEGFKDDGDNVIRKQADEVTHDEDNNITKRQADVVKNDEGKEQEFSILRYKDKIPVSDVDLYFNLLVFSTKPLCKSCKQLFQQSHAGAEGKHDEDKVMSRQEWRDFCNRAPVTLPKDIQEQMWKFMCKNIEVGIDFNSFVAGFHIHDTEERDPFIANLAQVQQLDYYDMDVQEMRDRLKAKGAQDAAVQLAFSGDQHDEGTAGARAAKQALAAVVELPLMEGEHRVTAPTTGAVVKRGALELPDQELPQVSMTNAQYGGRDIPKADSEMQSQSSASWLSSDALSRSDLGSDSFSMQDALSELDEGLRELDARQQVGRVGSVAGGRAQKSRKATKVSAASGKRKDPRYATDVFEVRQAIREANRNMPLEDFKSLINFMVRGIKLIMYNPNSSTRWHMDDPSFRYATGVEKLQPYARQLLLSMGFVFLGEAYWIWPYHHLKSPACEWGMAGVPADCPGCNKFRLKDMEALMKACQRRVATDKNKFRGHF